MGMTTLPNDPTSRARDALLGPAVGDAIGTTAEFKPCSAFNSAKGNGKHIILRVGAEGGSITLVGLYTEVGWQLRVVTSESALQAFADENPIAIADWPWVATWRSALKQLDVYPWTELYPLAVNHEFRDRVLKALQARQKMNPGLCISWEDWHAVLNIKP